MTFVTICFPTFPTLNLDGVSITSSYTTVNIFGTSIVLIFLCHILFLSPQPYLSCVLNWKQSFLNRGDKDRSYLSPLVGS